MIMILMMGNMIMVAMILKMTNVDVDIEYDISKYYQLIPIF